MEITFTVLGHCLECFNDDIHNSNQLYSCFHCWNLASECISHGVFQVKLHGYGGVSRLHCSEETMVSQTVQGVPCVSIQQFSKEAIKEVMIHNVGARCALVKVTVFKSE